MIRSENMNRVPKSARCGAFVATVCFLSVSVGPLLGAANGSDTAGSVSVSPANKPLPDDWDSSRYIGIDEIKPGMEAYCLTDYGDAGIEKFRLVVVDIIRKMEPGRDAILVGGLDERFIHTGPVGGCSGSPVYINNRLAGALSFAWPYSKDPLYGVTPIGEMLVVGRAGRANPAKQISQGSGLGIDFSKPLDFADVYKQITSRVGTSRGGITTATYLPSPLVVSGLSPDAVRRVQSVFEPLGFITVSGAGGADAKGTTSQLSPGAGLAIPLLSGDIEASVLGTVTEVRDGKVYGFGHGLLGYGSVDLPMATAEVYTVVSSLLRSFKISRPREIVGAITCDEFAAVFGRIGTQPKMIPITIRVNRYNDTQQRVYKCLAASNKSLTPLLVQMAIDSAAFQVGDLPPDHTVEYTVSIGTNSGESIRFHNSSTVSALSELMTESAASIALLMNNPFREAEIQSVECEMNITAKNISSHIWSVDVSDPKVEAGQEINVDVIIESVKARKTKYSMTFKIPEDLQPGVYSLTVCGFLEYERFLRKAVPYRFMVENFSSLVQALNEVLNIERSRLYCVLVLPPGGVAVERAELPDLPATKALVLQSPKRAVKIQPYPHWLEKTVETGTIIADKETVNIMVVER